MLLQNLPDGVIKSLCAHSLETQERNPFVAYAIGRNHWLSVNLSRRVRIVKVDVKPNTIVIWVWDPGRPSASTFGFVSVISVRDFEVIDVHVFGDREVPELGIMALKSSDLAGHILQSTRIV